MVDLTGYITTANSKLGSGTKVLNSGNVTYRVKETTVEVWQRPTQSTWTLETPTNDLNKIFNRQTLTETHPINNLPDSIAENVKVLLDIKLKQ